MSVMEQSNSLLLNEEALKQCPDQSKPVFIYEWLRYLDRILPVTQKADIKNCQQKLVQQLMERITTGPGSPTRQLLARCLAQVFTIADAYDLFQTINLCNDALKGKDDSVANLPVKLTALAVLGSMYESLGRMADIKNCQQKLVQQLMERITTGPGSPTRQLLARCLAQVFTIADAYDLFQTINLCNDALKGKDDSVANLPVKLTALAVLGSMYESLGRMVGRSYEEGFNLMVKWLKSAESSTRTEILLTISKMISGLGNAAFSVHKDLYKQLTKSYLTDRVMPVRAAAAQCLLDLVTESGSPVFSHGLDAISTQCLKALEGATYEVRLIIAKVYAKMAASTLENPKQPVQQNQIPKLSTIEFLEKCLAEDFLFGRIGGFLKSSSSVATAGGHKEIRVGIAYAYVEVINELGTSWLERNLNVFIKHIVKLAEKCGPLAYTNNPTQIAEVVYMRRCLSFIFRQTLGQMLSEPLQLNACKILGDLSEYTGKYDIIEVEEAFIVDVEAHRSAQAAIVSLLEISALVRQIGTAVTPLFMEATGIMEPINICLQHPVLGTRLAAAWCLRCVTYSVPPQRTVLIERYIKRLTNEANGKGSPETVHGTALALAALVAANGKGSPETVHGTALALAALVAGATDCELGIPFGKSKQLFTIAEDMIKTAAQTCKLALEKIKSGWLLISAVITMGTPFIRHNLNRLLLLWKYSFPRSLDEAKTEKQRGDSFTWECTLESRAGALASMANFMTHCSDLVDDDILPKIIQPIEMSLTTIDLVDDDVLPKIIQPIEMSLTTMSFVGDLVLSHGIKLRQPIYTFRIRLYSLLSKLKLKYVEHVFPAMLRELVADFSLSDNPQSSTCSSIISKLCSSTDTVFLSGWVRNTTQSELEEELYLSHLPNDKTFENDPLVLINSSVVDGYNWPEPLPVNVSSIDASILMFGRIYPLASPKQKLQLTNHFLNIFKASKNAVRQQSIHLNVLSAVLCAMKSMGELRNARIQGEELQKANMDLIIPFLNSERVLLRCLAIETLGQLSQAVGEPQFVAGNATLCSDKLGSNRDERSKTGFVLSLGSLHKHVGSLGSGQHLNRSIQDILSLTREGMPPTVQAWAILSLSLIATNGGGMFQGYVEPSLGLALKLLMNTAPTNVEVILCVGKLVSALITSVGPELQIGTMDGIRSSFLVASAMMFDHPDPQVKAEALACWQQLHLFAPRFVQLDKLVTNICNLLYNSHLVLRKAAVSVLRQLLQREVKEVREHAQALIPVGMMNHSKIEQCPLPETGLEGALFEMLDVETDKELRQHIKESLNFLVQATSGELLSHWLSMCKDILASSDTTRSTLVIDTVQKEKEEDTGDDEDTFQVSSGLPDKSREKVSPRWPTRIFAFDIVQKLMGVCDFERAHLDFALAKELQTSTAGKPDYLVLHLPDLVKMSFIGATSDNTNLRLAGLACLQDVINRFATVPDPSFPGDVILKQFQAQVGAALRPAFGSDTPSHVTAAACQVCSTWIGSGVAKDLNDLRRVHQLLTDSLDKCKKVSMSSQLYNESTVTLEKLAILKAWAEVYIGAVKEQEEKAKQTPENNEDDEFCEESLLNLVNPQLDELVGRWMSVLRDSALLSLPVEFANQLPVKGGTFYTPDSAESCKDYYRLSWPPILLATAIWLNRNDFEIPPVPAPVDSDRKEEHSKIWLGESKEIRLALLLGMCSEALCNSRNYTDSDKTIQLCLNTLKNLIECKWAQLELMKDVRIAVELMNILHRQVLTRDNLQTQRLCADVVLAILSAAMTAISVVNEEDVMNGNIDGKTAVYKGYPGGEGINGFDSNSSLSFATLEIALCLLVRQIPQINSALMKSKSSAPLHFRKYTRLSSEGCELVKLGIRLLIQIPKLCSSDGAIVVLPTVYYLVLGVLRESSRIDVDNNGDHSTGHVTAGAASAMVALKELASQPPSEPGTFESWSSVVRSSLLSLLNMVEGESRVDKAVVMLAATVMTTSLPANFAVGAPLFHKLCRLLKNCLNHSSPAIQHKALQSLSSIFLRKEIAAPYVKELGPIVFDKIRPYVLPESEAKSPTIETDLPLLKDISEAEAMIIQETVKTIESILKLTSNSEKELLFVNLLVRCLGRLLCNDPTNELVILPPHTRRLHDFAFQRINAIAPVHPEAFKTIVQACPAIKQRIEKAAQLVSRSSQMNQIFVQQQKLSTIQQQNQTEKKPTIELKMDFASNFAAN
uniref:HEAT repeat-containing protein 5B n=1 Tax=Panagrolaimus sp. JU765 TaxID=591449 RepID=A0AC34Q6C8_9BILA